MSSRRRPGRYVETEEYVRFLHRILGALASRVGDADIAMLHDLANLSGLVEELVSDTVHRLRAEHGYSWADVGQALDITRQAAQQRFGRQPGVDG